MRIHRAASALFVVLGLIGCGGGDDSNPSATGGAGGSAGASGSAGTGGTSEAGTGGTAGSSDAGDDASPDAGNPPVFHPECVTLPSTTVIGNWDLVPFQRVEGAFEVGVVAFHELGVDVVFSVNGTEVARVQDPTRNPRTGVYEYWFALDASDYPDGAIALGATIEPDCDGHLPRTLDDVTLYANAGGSLSNDEVRWVDCAAGDDGTGSGTETAPYATVEKAFTEVASGGTVLLKAGDCYLLTDDLPSSDYDLWTTVRPAPGVARGDVVITADGPGSTGRFGENMVRWQDVGLRKDVDPGYSTVLYLESGHSVWFDGTEIFDERGQFNGGQITGGNNPYWAYYTDALVRDIQNSQLAFNRNVTIERLGSDAMRGYSGLTSIGLTILGIDSGTTDAHPDFIQFYNPDSLVENVIVYGARVFDMGAQGIFGGPGQMKDIAFVNLLMEKDPADSALISQLTGDWDHVLMWHVTTVDAGMLVREPALLKNFFVQDCLWATFSAGAASSLPGFTIDHNHVSSLTWDQPEPMGTNATVGDPLFVGEPTDDYHLQSSSPAAGAGVPLPGVPADIEGTWYDAENPSLGAYETE